MPRQQTSYVNVIPRSIYPALGRNSDGGGLYSFTLAEASELLE